MNNQEYEINEARRFAKDLADANRGTLSEKRFAQSEFIESLETDLSHFKTAVRNVIAGNYGYGAYACYRRLSVKMNRRAWLFVTVAALEYGVNSTFARNAWKRLSPELQATIDTVINEAILSSESDD